jgi:hypothetical protein
MNNEARTNLSSGGNEIHNKKYLAVIETKRSVLEYTKFCLLCL